MYGHWTWSPYSKRANRPIKVQKVKNNTILCRVNEKHRNTMVELKRQQTLWISISLGKRRKKLNDMKWNTHTLARSLNESMLETNLYNNEIYIKNHSTSPSAVSIFDLIIVILDSFSLLSFHCFFNFRRQHGIWCSCCCCWGIEFFYFSWFFALL